VNAGKIDVGLDIITQKLATSLKTTLNEAQDIQKDYAGALLKAEHFCSWVKINKSTNEEFILQSEMIRKILPEVNLIIGQIKKILEKFSSEKAFCAVFCSSGSWLNYLIESLEKQTSMTLKLFPSNEPEFDNVIGAINEYKETIFKKEKNILEKILDWINKNI
jgi:cell division ATPase FtsA